MPDYLEIAKLRSHNFSQRAIAKNLGLSRNTVSNVFILMDLNHLNYDQMKQMPPEQLHPLLEPKKERSATIYAEPDYPSLAKELVKPGVTMRLLWEEYTDKCFLNHLVPYRHTQFELHFSKYLSDNNFSEIIKHKAGERCELDWVGTRPQWANPETGEIERGWIFVGVLPFSDYGYAEATENMSESTWIYCNEHMFSYFKGVTPLTVIDNLKTGVVSHPRGDEAILNKNYVAMADYYGTSIFAGNVRSPHAKPSIENFVRIIETDVMPRMRNCQFFSVEDYNKQLLIELERVNTKPFERKSGTRKSLYEQFEVPLLLPLPIKPYEPFILSHAKVINNFHISCKRNYYSVPSASVKIGQLLSLRIFSDHIDIYDKDDHQCLCSHRLFDKHMIGQYSTDPSHMPASPNGEWSRDRFTKWAMRLGANVYELVLKVFDGGKPEQVYYAKIHSILKTADTFGAAELDRACRWCLDHSINPTTKNIKALITADVQEKEPVSSPAHTENVFLRGDDYYDRQK